MPSLKEKLKNLLKSEEEIVLKSVDEEHRLFLGVVLEPEEYDLHKDIYSADAIRKACESEQEYLQSNVQHSLQVGSDVMDVTKSFIQEVEATIGNQVIKAGTWLREAKINNDLLWEAVKKGEFTGWSIGCSAKCDDVPVDCIKSTDDIEKAKWDHSKFQRLDDFDFSTPGAHIALVDRAANGWEALVIKSAPQEDEDIKFDLESVEKELLKRLDIESISKQDGDEGPMVSMSLSKLLQIAFYVYGEDADFVANAITKSEDSDKLITEVSELLKDGLLGSPIVAKPNNGENPKMSDENVVKAADVQAMIDKAVKGTKAELEKSVARIEKFEAAEEIRKELKFSKMAEGYQALGDVEGLGEVLKSLSETEGFDKVLGLLDSAVETINKSALLDEEGDSGEGEVLSNLETLKKLAAAKAEEDGITIQKAMTLVAAEKPELLK